MDTRHVLDELLAQCEEQPAIPAGLDAEEAELVRRLMELAPRARAWATAGRDAEDPSR